MSGVGTSRASDLWGVVRIALTLLMMAGAGGFLVGGVIGEGSVETAQGLLFGALFAIAALVVGVCAGWWVRRRAARFGLGLGRFLRVGRQVQRGEVPADPAEREVAVHFARRHRRAIRAQGRRWVRYAMGFAALSWLLGGVARAVDGDYGMAVFSLVMLGVFLVNPLTLRRQERHLERAERALGLDERAGDASDAERGAGLTRNAGAATPVRPPRSARR
ncbi:hypothetical protein [Streptomyces sp. NPDC046939]|uniref:hypothetical protein n=1 Tax=Streptomyces sp. NPDC046939 TaxID=3155376 RepID=UPI0033E4811D